MVAKIILFSYKHGELNSFLSKFYTTDLGIDNYLSWQKNFNNPVEMSELIAAFVDNINSYEINMWISLDENVFVKITSTNADTVIKYLFERYPY